MLLANGALNVLAKIVSSTREDEHGDNNMQLEALSVMFNLVKAGYGSAQSRGGRNCSSRHKRVGFCNGEATRLTSHYCRQPFSTIARQEIACKVIKQISGFGGQTL